MKTRKKQVQFIILVLWSVMLGNSKLLAQNYQATAANSTLKVQGTSNVHDWDMSAEQFTVKAMIEKNGETIEIKTLSLEALAEGLKSGKGGMDKNTYKALKTDKSKNIRFNATKTVSINLASANTYKVEMEGVMEIAGKKQTTNISFDLVSSNNGYTLTGAKLINMPEYDVTPPTALMGTIKTGADVTIEYNINLK